jgi:hypothetical protein
MPSRRTLRARPSCISRRSSCSSDSGMRGRNPPSSHRSEGAPFPLTLVRRWYVSNRNVRKSSSKRSSERLGLSRFLLIYSERAGRSSFRIHRDRRVPASRQGSSAIWVKRSYALSATGTCSAEDVLAADRAWPLRAHAPGRAMPRNLRLEPIRSSDLRIDNSAPTSQHRADPSSPGRQPYGTSVGATTAH